MNVKTNANESSRQRKRWWFILLLILVLIALLGYGIHYRNLPAPLSEAELELVGTWRLRGGDPEGELGYGYELHSDRTCAKLFFDRKTGVLFYENTTPNWWRNGDRFVVRLPSGAGTTIWRVWHKSIPADEVFTLTPDGPGRFRFQGSTEIEFLPAPSPQDSGTMIRVDGPKK